MKVMTQLRRGGGSRSRRGGTVVEYALVILLIFLATYGGIKSLGSAAVKQVQSASGVLAGQGGGGGGQSGSRQGAPGTVDYCGSTGTEWVPDQIGSVDMRNACRIHDECYANQTTTKEQCDQELELNIIRDNPDSPIMSRIVGEIYHTGVQLGGQDAWDQSQRELQNAQ